MDILRLYISSCRNVFRDLKMAKKCASTFWLSCKCSVDGIWEKPDQRIVLYPKLDLIVWRGLVFQYVGRILKISGLHVLLKVKEFSVKVKRVVSDDDNKRCCYLQLCMKGSEEGSEGRSSWNRSAQVKGLGLGFIRRIQRFWRRALWRWRALPFMMVTHARLGRDSLFNGLEKEMLQLCLSCI